MQWKWILCLILSISFAVSIGVSNADGHGPKCNASNATNVTVDSTARSIISHLNYTWNETDDPYKESEKLKKNETEGPRVDSALIFRKINELLFRRISFTTYENETSDNIIIAEVGCPCSLGLSAGLDYAYLLYASAAHDEKLENGTITVERGETYAKHHRQAIFGKYNKIRHLFKDYHKTKHVMYVCEFNLSEPAERRTVCAEVKTGKGKQTKHKCVKCDDQETFKNVVNNDTLLGTTCAFVGFRAHSEPLNSSAVKSFMLRSHHQLLRYQKTGFVISFLGFGISSMLRI